jgi:hypothetical protein
VRLKHAGSSIVSTNIGSVDRVIRIVLGLALLSLLALAEGKARWWGLVGLVPLLTAFAGTCPLYGLLGVSTRSADHK